MYVSPLLIPGRNRNLAPAATAARMGPISTSLLLAIIIAVLAILYLTQITKTSVFGYRVSDLTDQRKTLVEKQQALEVEAARLKSLANIGSRPVVGSLTPETAPKFSHAATKAID